VTGASEVITFEDEELPAGVTVYRAVIFLKSDERIETNETIVYYADAVSFFLFPNPVERMSQDLVVLTDGSGLGIYFYDRTGRLVKRQKILNSLFHFSVADLDPGLYLYRIQRGSQWVSSGKILLR
jgi:predicted hotdog family 3-hydroxylacyl-ACP dehydratase